ncbi:MAG: radical SAM protein [Desulfurococcales archaeon]|nr:radical SAM protein [Desulfurococcales archaeon]
MARIAILYPSTYEAALSSLVFHMIYFLGNSFDEVFVERFVLTQDLIDKKLNELRSLDTGSPLRDFPLILASIHYEPDYVNLIRALMGSGIDVLRHKRRHIVLVGGPAPMANPVPLENIVDAVIVGEVENSLPEILRTWLEHMNDPRGFLEALACKKGFYVPGYNSGAERTWVSSLDNTFYPIRQIQGIGKEPVYGRGFLLEVSRGCPLWCRFCMEGRLFKPFRQRSIFKLTKLISEGTEVNRVNRIIVYSLFFPTKNDHYLLEYLIKENYKASLPSMRIDLISESTLDLVSALGQRTITVAPENVSGYGERVLCKCFRGRDFVKDTLSMIIRKNFDLKMYFILGIKGEDITSIKENISFIKELARLGRQRGRRVTITVNPLIPKPKTPFQWIGMIELDKAKNIIRYVRNELGRAVDTRPLYVNWAWVQASIALADKSIAPVLISWARYGGDLGGWRKALAEHNYSTKYVFTGWSYGSTLPWDKIRIGYYVEDVVEQEYFVLRKLVSLPRST